MENEKKEELLTFNEMRQNINEIKNNKDKEDEMKNS